MGKRNGCVGSASIPPAGHPAGAVLEAEPLHLVCHIHRQATTASPDRVLDPVASDIGQQGPLV